MFIELGVDRLRVTGGEPLLRRDLSSLVNMLAAKPGLADLAMTTNGILLADQIESCTPRHPPRHGQSSTRCGRDRFISLARFDELARCQRRHCGGAPGVRTD